MDAPSSLPAIVRFTENCASDMRSTLKKIEVADRSCQLVEDNCTAMNSWSQSDQTTLLETASKKVSLANEAYESVERCIREIDSHLKSAEDALRKTIFTLRGSAAVKKPGLANPRSSMSPTDVLNTYPSEPLYCLCRKVQFGDMIACDEDSCDIEWYHYECVGLKTAPKGKWYCPGCRLKRAPVKAPSLATTPLVPKSNPSRLVNKPS
uniref:PHD-type domain-containing protein n=1 Tax=Spongospora subterranea TaxID=70186 RepID=A0A0H5RC02_9EUKA|eukprot:CRZ11132.1 hypothetical protein [Spongospora subterranea]